MSGRIVLGAERYGVRALRDIAAAKPGLSLSEDVCARIAKGEAYVATKLSAGAYIYGVNSGFGALCETGVPDSQLELLQYNHIVSHACGVDSPVSERVSRLAMLVKLLTLRAGHSGVSLRTVQALLALWNAGIIPAIPQRGTVGASGDLSPLAHMALPLLGLGKVHYGGSIIDAGRALEQHGLAPVRLRPKDGLALTNGVQYISACAVDSLVELGNLIGAADMIAALSIQAFSCAKTFYSPLYQSTSLHVERMAVAKTLCAMLEGSNHHELETCNVSKQDPYSYRCIPQVHGAVRQAYTFARQTVENECNGVSDNPLFFPDEDEVLLGGALHGESVAMAADFLAMAASELGSISERRTYQLLSGRRGLPSFLVAEPGVNSGLMIVQYTSAALVNESKVLCTPACVDTIPTCQLQEDHVSMGGTSVYKLERIIRNVSYVLGIELMSAAQAAELLPGLKLSPASQELMHAFRRRVPYVRVDEPLSGYLEAAREFVVEEAPRWGL